MQRIIATALSALSLTLPCASQATVSAQDVSAFLAKKPAVYGEPTAPSEKVLTILLKNLPKPGFKAAVHELAQSWHIREDAAALIAEAQLRIETIVEEMRESEPLPGGLRNYYRRAVELEPDSAEVWTAAMESRCDDDVLRERYFRRPDALRRFLTSGTESCGSWLLPLAATSKLSPLGHWRLVELFDSGGVETERLAVRQELIAQLHSAGYSPASPELLYLLRAQWLDLATVGLGDEILKQADALDARTLAAVLDEEKGGTAKIEGIAIVAEGDARKQVHDLQVSWLLALKLANRGDEATQWRERLHFTRPNAATEKAGKFSNHVFATPHGDADEFVYQVLAPVTDADPFDLFIADGISGLWWSVGNDDPLSMRATLRSLDERRYGDIARDMHEQLCQPPYTGAIGGQFPVYLEASRSAFRAAIQAQRQASGCAATPAKEIPTVARSQADYVEKPLPSELWTLRRPSRRHHEDEEEGDDESAALQCVPDRHVVRCDQTGSAWAAISISGDLDPTGEIGGGGYWLHLSQDAGRHWQPPIYLGLQEMQPYVVSPTSKLPLIHGTTLQMEVQVRELDPASITFPPVGLRSLREADDLYIERELGDLTQDSDGDGLSDIVEDKLRTDPRSADTDHDGLDDDIDPLPQVSVRESPDADAGVVTALLAKVAGYDAAAIRTGMVDARQRNDVFAGLSRWSRSPSARVMYLKADAALFKGLMVPDKLILLTDKDVAYLNARYGVHYPLGFPLWFNRDHTRAVSNWSAGWVGGTLLFTRQDKTWTTTVVEQWIT